MRRALPLAVMVALLGTGAAAREVGRSEFQAFMDLASGSKHNLTLGGSGSPLPTTGTPGPTAVGNMNFSHAGGGWPTASGTAKVPSPVSGKDLTTGAKQAFTKASSAKALARFAFGFAGPIGVGLAIYATLNQMDQIEWDYLSGQNKPFKMIQKQVYGYYCRVDPGQSSCRGADSPSAEAACAASGTISNDGVSYHYTRAIGTQIAADRWTCMTTFLSRVDGQPATMPAPQRRDDVIGRNPGGTVQEKKYFTMSELEEKIAAESGWPSGSSINAALADAVNAGQTLETEGNPTLTPVEPKLESAPKTTTRSDGSSDTEKLVCDYIVPLNMGLIEFQCNVVKTTVTPPKTATETVVRSNPDGTTSTETITRSTPGTTTTSTTTRTEEADPTAEKLKIDESNTPTTVTLSVNPEAISTTMATRRTDIASDKTSIFGSAWNSLFSAPPVAECVPITMPEMMGMAVPDLNPCGVVGPFRSVMAFLWAFVGFGLCVYMIREVI